jgi:hypothetical protein
MDSARFLSANGYAPRIWGPKLWFIMSLIASNFPLIPSRADSLSYYRFFDNLRRVLPCKSCRDEYTKMITSHPDEDLRLRLDMFIQKGDELPGAARKRVFTWVTRIHSAVNKRLGKRRRTSLEFWARAYSRLRTSTSNVNVIKFPTGNL